MHDSDLTLEKLKIAERMTSMEDALKALVDLKKTEHNHLYQIIKRQEEMLERVVKTLYGNGTPGLTTITSNHANMLKLMLWGIGLILATMLTFGVRAVMQSVGMRVG